jgi:hypothetical protein
VAVFEKVSEHFVSATDAIDTVFSDRLTDVSSRSAACAPAMVFDRRELPIRGMQTHAIGPVWPTLTMVHQR